MTVRDLYAVLGVPRDATASAIRRAYKERCLRVHPDKQPAGARRAAAEALFKELAAAYSTLSDAPARARHDAELSRNSSPTGSRSERAPRSPFADEEFARRFASNFEKKMREDSRNGDAPLDGEDLFDALFGERRANFRFRASPSPGAGDDTDQNEPSEDVPEPPRAKAPDREVELTLSLEELHTGCVKRRRLHRTTRGADGTYTRVATVMRIDVKPGYRPGDKVRFRDAGDESATSAPPDVVFVIAQTKHKRFTRTGDDLAISVSVALGDALTGVQTCVVGIDNTRIDINIDSVVKPGTTHIVRGAGLSRRGDAARRGDLHVHFGVTFPDRLLPAERAALRDVFVRIAARKEGGGGGHGVGMRRSASLFMQRRAAAASASSADFGASEARSIGGGEWCAASTTSAPATPDVMAHGRFGPEARRTASSSRRKESEAGLDKSPSSAKSGSPRHRAKGKGRFGTFFR